MANLNDLETIKKETEPSYDPNSTETIENMTERAAPDALKDVRKGDGFVSPKRWRTTSLSA